MNRNKFITHLVETAIILLICGVVLLIFGINDENNIKTISECKAIKVNSILDHGNNLYNILVRFIYNNVQSTKILLSSKNYYINETFLCYYDISTDNILEEKPIAYAKDFGVLFLTIFCIISLIIFLLYLSKKEEQIIPICNEVSLTHLCIICKEHEPKYIYIPCNHFCLCQFCHTKIENLKCPMCNLMATNINKVYIS